MADIANNSEFPDIPSLSELFATHTYEGLFPPELDDERRKRIRRLLWDGVEDLLSSQEVLNQQIVSQREELLRIQEEKDAVTTEVGQLRGELGELQASLHTDSLTGLLNGRGFEKKYQDWLKENEADPGKEFYILYFDVNDLKLVNDKYAHSAGDMVIAYFAEALRQCTRKSDAAAHIHGDEFVLGLPGARSPAEQSDYKVSDNSEFDIKNYVQQLPGRITEWMESSIDDKNAPEGMLADMTEILRNVQFSYGIRVCRGKDFEQPIEELLHDADKEMYVHKRHTKASKAKEPDYSI
jgi:GGDEF domain-containing protein